MAETPISGLPEGVDLTGDELVPIVQNGVTRRIFINKLKQVITKESLGLDKVNNTPDSEKPVSGPQQQALDGKAEKVHSHEITDVTGLEDALSNKAARRHGHELTDVTGITEALDAKADKTHSHVSSEVTDLDEAIRKVIAGSEAGNFVISGNVEW